MLCPGFPQENYAFFALGVPTEDHDEIRDHLASHCDVCERNLLETQTLCFGIAQSAPHRTPSPVLRRRIVNAVAPQPARTRQWLWPLWAGAASTALAGLCVFLLIRADVPTGVRTVAIPSPVSVSVQVLEQENRRLKAALDARLAAPAAPLPAPARSTSPAPVAPDPLRAPLDQALRNAAAEQARSAQLEADLAQQKALVATAQRDLQEANRKVLAAAAAPANSVSSNGDAQKQLAALTARSAELERQVAQYKLLLAAEHARLENSLQLASLLSSPDLTLVHLRTSEAGGRSAEGHALIRAGAQVLFYGSGLPALPAGRTYQLWLIRAQSPAIVSAGVFAPNAQRRATVLFSGAAFTSGITGVAVTDEPAGGSEKPTGHKLLIGQTAPAV